jgi:hypothetical protein
MQPLVADRNVLATQFVGLCSLAAIIVSNKNMNDMRHFHYERSLDLSYNTLLPRGRPPSRIAEGSDW